jgi:hypothetical protein
MLLLGVAVIVGGSLWRADVDSVRERPRLEGPEFGIIAAADEFPPAAAAGMGFANWWGKHGTQVVEFAGCMLDGAGLARLLIAGISGVGGVLVAAGLVVAALACLT